jgi:small conductance mechanosensitive channel
VIVVIILSMLLAIKDFIPNVFAGLFLHRKGFLKKGDNIIVKDVKGKIIYINLVETRVQTKEGDIIYIPNTLLTKSEVRKIKH